MTEPTRELTQADADKLAETILQLPREQFFRKEIRAIIWQAAREAPPATGEGWIENRFDEFEDDSHPFRKWWTEHGQYMMSGGGRRESIWAARGWIAREQLACGAKVTGESLRERAQPDPPKEGKL